VSGVSIDPDTMRTVVAKAILDGLSQEQRDLVIEQAVKALITPTKPAGSFGSATGPSPLQQAFDMAVHRACNKVADEILANTPEFQERLRGLFSDTVKSAMQSADWDLQRKISEAVMLAVLTP
jgi:hypothetical protein